MGLGSHDPHHRRGRRFKIESVESDPAQLLQEWLQESRGEGRLDSRGRFTMEQGAAGRLAQIARLTLSDVPLLLLAAAVESGSRYFRVHGERNLRFSWEEPAGPSGEVAHLLLRQTGVDVGWDQRGLELPSGFRDYLGPLWDRGQHAPLTLVWGNQALGQGATSGGRMLVRRASVGRLTLVDRGIDFGFPAAFPGLDIVAWVDPLPGWPWPRRLVWSPKLKTQLARIARGVHSLSASPT